jgi:hypothetical protein
MVTHLALQLALRVKALTLSVATTGSISMSATLTGYARAAGSFLTDGLALGMEITPVGFASNPVDVITGVTALAVTTKNGRTVESAGSGRSLTVGLPSDRAWENVQLIPSGKPYVEEQYIPGPMVLESEGANGNVTLEPMYQLQIYTPEQTGIGAGSRYVDALTTLFAPSTEIPVGSEILFVRPSPGPFRGQRQIGAPGYSTIPFTVPLRIYSSNSI